MVDIEDSRPVANQCDEISTYGPSLSIFYLERLIQWPATGERIVGMKSR